MPLTIHKKSHPPKFSITNIAVGMRSELIKALALLYLCKTSHVRKILQSLAPTHPKVQVTVFDQAIKNLCYVTAEIAADLACADPKIVEKAERRREVGRFHRDGLLFQNISWVAAAMDHPECIASPPHAIKAHKGFDGLLIDVSSLPTNLDCVILCEDKATDGPRNTISQKVFPELASLVKGDRDLEIMKEITPLLSGLPEDEREDLLESLVWENVKRFRITVTAHTTDAKKGCYAHLFKDYEDHAPGPLNTREGCVMPFSKMRDELEAIANDVIAELEIMKNK